MFENMISYQSCRKSGKHIEKKNEKNLKKFLTSS